MLWLARCSAARCVRVLWWVGFGVCGWGGSGDDKGNWRGGGWLVEMQAQMQWWLGGWRRVVKPCSPQRVAYSLAPFLSLHMQGMPVRLGRMAMVQTMFAGFQRSVTVVLGWPRKSCCSPPLQAFKLCSLLHLCAGGASESMRGSASLRRSTRCPTATRRCRPLCGGGMCFAFASAQC